MAARVDTRSGRIQGCEEDGLRVFRGIPYARPPLGPRRFAPPEPPEPWPGLRQGIEFAPRAPQNAGMIASFLGVESEAQSEDCLVVNVWTPGVDAGARPVLVWIHGGGFTTGSSGWAVYDGAPLARRGDLVVISLNYRLGALGYLPLRHEDGVVGNFGLLDQIAALEWVRDHAADFGGDPGNVTLVGSSAGAMSIATLLATPRAQGLFARAIIQSGAADYVHDLEDATRVAEVTAQELGLEANDMAAHRAVAPDALVEAQARATLTLRRELPRIAFQPVVDGALLPRVPIDAVADGRAAKVPLLVGTNLDEWRFYGLADPKASQLDDAGLLRRFRRGLPGEDERSRPWAERVIETYREAREETDAPSLWFAIQTDRWFRHPSMRLAQWHAARGNPTWTYLFDWPSPAFGGALGSCHSLEVPFVMGTAAHPRLRPLVGEGNAVEQLSAAMQDTWLAFVRGGEPRHPELGSWPGYDGDRRTSVRLGAETRVEERPFEAERAFWDEIDGR